MAASCGQVREMSGQSANGSGASNGGAAEKRTGGVELPGNMKNAVRDTAIDYDRAAVVTLTNNTDFQYRNDAQKLSTDELGKKFDEFAGAAQANTKEPKIVYLRAAGGVDYGAIVKVLELARRKGFTGAKFVVNRGGGDADAPETFTLELAKERHPDDAPRKPNPNTLIVKMLEGGIYTLNREGVTLTEISTRMPEIFKYRETNLVLREGTNEVEKTVTIKAPPTAKYEEVLRLIDAVKGTGAHPIVIGFDEPEIEKVYFK